MPTLKASSTLTEASSWSFSGPTTVVLETSKIFSPFGHGTSQQLWSMFLSGITIYPVYRGTVTFFFSFVLFLFTTLAFPTAFFLNVSIPIISLLSTFFLLTCLISPFEQQFPSWSCTECCLLQISLSCRLRQPYPGFSISQNTCLSHYCIAHNDLALVIHLIYFLYT